MSPTATAPRAHASRVVPEHLRPKALSKVQRDILDHMLAHGGKSVIYSGHRHTMIGRNSATVWCAVNAIDSLLMNGLIENAPAPPSRLYRITDYGRKRRAGARTPKP